MSLAVALLSCVSASPAFDAWLAAHPRDYVGTSAYAYRAAVFARNEDEVAAANADAAAGFTLELNEFADMTAEEFAAFVAGAGGVDDAAAVAPAGAPPNSALPASVDWQAAGVVTPVPSSGSCGGAGAASSFVGAVESAWALATGKLRPLGAAQALACGCGGCDCPLSALYAWGKAAGLTAAYNGSCAYAPDVRVQAEVRVRAGSEDALLAALAQQPVIVAVNASTPAFRFYKAGVLSALDCGAAPSATLLAVGYGTTPAGLPFYRLRNAWGANWGEAGYVRLARGADFNPDGECGVQRGASYPVVASTA